MKTKLNLLIKTVAVVFALCTIVVFMVSCGKAVTVKITDGKTVTDVEAKTGDTVEKILKNAEITLGEKDEVEPSLDSKLEETQNIIIKRYAKVTVIYGKDMKTVELNGATVKEAAEKAGYELGKEFIADADADDYLKDGMKITVSKSRVVKLTVDGETKKCKTFADTVKEFLDEQKIELGEKDEVSAKLDDKIKNNSELTVKRVEYKTETRTEAVPFKTERKNDSSLEKGKTEVVRSGVNGERKATYKVKYVDGKAVEETLESEEILKNPVSEVIKVGTKAGRTIVSKQPVYDCNGSGHGYYVITYSDGKIEYEEF